MAKVKDIRNRTKRSNGTRNKDNIKTIVRHHSATTTGDFDTFWKYWNGTKGWGTGGYHEIILRDGTVELCYNVNEITNGAHGHNATGYHICLVGNGSFTKAQEEAWNERVAYNMDRLNIRVNDVKGHGELSGANTSCPGIDMDGVRNRIKGNSSTGANIKVDGYWGRETTRALQNALNTVADGEIWGQYKGNQATKALTGGVKFGTGGSPVIKVLQGKIGAKRDGVMGKETVKKLQKYLGTPVDGEIWKPSAVVKELQRRLNAGTF